MQLSWHGRVLGIAAFVLAFGVAFLVLPGTALAGPDIIVQSITTDPVIPDVGVPFTLTIVSENQGDSSTGNFWNHVYLDPADQPPTGSTPYTKRYNNFPLPPGDWIEYTYSSDSLISFATEGCDHTIWVWADAADDVTESVESNNVLSQTICVGVECQVDAYEDDDSCAAAGFVTNTIGIAQPHTFCPTADDEDWVKFSAVAGITYTVEADATGAHAQPAVQLLSGCGGAPQYGTGATFSWVCPATGLYYLRVTDDDPEDGPLTGYALSVRAEGSSGQDLYEPDNTCATARDIQVGAAYSQTHYFETQGDQDWVKWPVEAGATYVLVADQAASGVSPQVTLFGSCAESFGASQPQGPSATFDAAESGMLYARVANADPDVYGGDATYRLTLTKVACSNDAFEEDDGPAQAKTIIAGGTPGTHTICPAGDQDWVKFSAVAGTVYLLETSDLGPDADTDLTLYGTDGATVLDQNDDYTPGLLNSRIVWQAPSSGTYYAMVRHVKASAAGASTRYNLSLSEGSCTADAADRTGGDNMPQRAVPIGTTGSPLTRNFCPLGDQDWFSVDVSGSGTAITVRTSGLGYDGDTVVDLIAPDGITVLSSNDDYTVGQASYITTTVSTPGRYYVRATHYNTNHFGSGTGYQLSVWAQTAPTPTPSPTPLPTPAPTATPIPVPSDVRTVILVNRERVETLYGVTDANDLMAKLYELAAHERVKGAVLQVEQDPSVAMSYSVWAADPLDTAKANAVAAGVRGLGLAFIASNPSVEHIVIVGNDRMIPFRRLPDHTGKPESHYADEVTDGTTQQAACEDDMSLTDACYADALPSTWAQGEYCLPDYGIGRLVETPDEIVAFIDAFLALDGVIDLNAGGSKGLVSGYSFVTDAASLIKSLFSADSLAATSVISETWSSGTLQDIQLGDTRYTLQSVNGHATHTQQKAPDNSSVDATDIASSTTDLAGALVFTVGCHSGLNDTGTLDLAQAFARKKANYVANTGYGWGGGGVTFSEALMRNYALELLTGTSTDIGTALARAKARYVQQVHAIDGYDEKILLEATLYGLPMYQLVTSGAFQDEDPFPSADVATTLPGGAFGTLNEGGLTCSLDGFGAFDDTPDPPEDYFGEGSFYALDNNVAVAAGEPIQPRFYATIDAPSAGTLRGALFLGGVYTDVTGYDPVVAQPFNEYVTPGPEPAFDAPGWYPPVPFSVQNGDTSQVTADSLVALMGQYNAASGTERLYEHLSFDTYYSSDPDYEPPTISYVNGLLDSAHGTGEIKVEASDPSDVVRVVVAFTEGDGEWLSGDLAYEEATLKWKGEITATAQTRFLVQAVDGAGNVQVAQNKGVYYRLQAPAPLVSAGSRVTLPLVVRP